jgi:hypothetical protein
MTADQRLLLTLSGEGSLSDRALTLLYLTVSSRARAKRDEFLTARRVLFLVFADPDEVYTVRFKRPLKAVRRVSPGLILLAGLLILLITEWSTYTLPSLAAWTKTVLHSCGLN